MYISCINHICEYACVCGAPPLGIRASGRGGNRKWAGQGVQTVREGSEGWPSRPQSERCQELAGDDSVSAPEKRLCCPSCQRRRSVDTSIDIYIYIFLDIYICTLYIHQYFYKHLCTLYVYIYVLIYKLNLTVMYIYRYIPSVCLRSLEEQSGFSRGQRTALGTLLWLRRSHTTTSCKGH